MASLLLPSPSSSSTSPPSSLSSSLFSRSSLNHRCLRANAPRSRICLRNVVKCSLSEPLNGKPCVPILNDGSLSKFLASKRLESAVHRSNNRLKIFSGTANPSLSQEIAWYMGLDLGRIKIKRFADGEIYVQLQESVRGCDVYLVQPTCPPANENLMELLIMIDACRRASAKNITAVIPYFGYARADRKASLIYDSD
ncbi:hypothetical protein RHMOL_Rhmol07G0146100 [Rhododendron molle]|uniref:Uncharacterized protein n=1 Tax=Rhododendron molle TaxID=49168 RepID=A0ACC0N0I8_RHOML|nr:hypothetical protein RHMOL_Rhmol07G0146100 [Rhododendron molle]